MNGGELSRPLKLEDINDRIDKFITSHDENIGNIMTTIGNHLDAQLWYYYNELVEDLDFNRYEYKPILKSRMEKYIADLDISYLIKYINIKEHNHRYVLDICYNSELMILESIKSHKNVSLWTYNTQDNSWINNIIKSTIMSTAHNYLVNVDTFISLLYLSSPRIMINIVNESKLDRLITVDVAIDKLKEILMEQYNTKNIELVYLKPEDRSYTFNNKFHCAHDEPCVIFRY